MRIVRDITLEHPRNRPENVRDRAPWTGRECWSIWMEGKAPITISTQTRRVNRAALVSGMNEEAFLDFFILDPETAGNRVSALMQEQGYPDTQRVPVVQTLAAFGVWLFRRGIVSSRPQIRQPRRVRKYVDRDEKVNPLDVARIGDLIDKMENPGKRAWSQALLGVLFPCGLRVSEAASIRAGGIGADSVKIVEKGRRDYVPIPLPKAVIRLLTDLRDLNAAEGFADPSDPKAALFIRPSLYLGFNIPTELQPRQVTTRTIQKTVDEWAGWIGKEFTPHDFRRAAITAARDNGVPVEAAAAFFRHSTVEMQALYDTKKGARARSVGETLMQGIEAARALDPESYAGRKEEFEYAGNY